VRSLGLLELGKQALLDMCRKLSLVKDEIDGEFCSARIGEKIVPQGVFPQLFSLFEHCSHCAIAEAKLGINMTNAVQDRRMADAPVLTPDEHTEHDTHKEQPPDSASDHGATYRSGAEDTCPIPIGISEKNSIV
jgi:hypothetical protein